MNLSQKAKIDAIIIALSICGILALYFVSISVSPVEIKIADVASYEGRTVSVSGFASDVEVLKSGQIVFTLTDGNNATAVFASGAGYDFESGDLLKVSGQIQRYKGGYEIIVKDADGIRVLETATSSIRDFKNLTLEPAASLNATVSIRGMLKYEPSVYNGSSSFYISETAVAGRYSLRVECFGAALAHKGDFVSVRGAFLYDAQSARYYIDAESCDIIRSYGTWSVDVVELAGYASSYLNANVSFSGTARNITNASFELCDLSGACSIAARSPAPANSQNAAVNTSQISVPDEGANVLVQGKLLYDDAHAVYFIEVTSLRENGGA